MTDHKEITTIEDVIGILETKINEFQTHIHSRKPDSKDPDYAYIVGQHNGLMFAQTLLIQLQRNVKDHSGN